MICPDCSLEVAVSNLNTGVKYFTLKVIPLRGSGKRINLLCNALYI
jgi:hypothetical protein